MEYARVWVLGYILHCLGIGVGEHVGYYAIVMYSSSAIRLFSHSTINSVI